MNRREFAGVVIASAAGVVQVCERIDDIREFRSGILFRTGMVTEHGAEQVTVLIATPGAAAVLAIRSKTATNTAMASASIRLLASRSSGQVP